jgi:serine/threonine protein kinase/Flp pilus assembly protein TadD
MQQPSQQISACPNCGGVLEETSTGELGCMSCLLRAGIGSEEETVHDSTPDALGGSMRFGVYEIDHREDGSLYELGRGAMGITYRASDTTLQRKVALKIIKTDIAERSPDARERFMREARAAAALRHENIATVYQFGMRLETGQYFYAMELIEGETLDERVHRAGPLDARTTIAIAQQVTSALAAAEKHGLVHRDLKPANLMLINADDAEVARSDQARFKRRGIGAPRNSGIPMVKIIDFGLAKAFHTATDPKSLTHDRFVGTPAFASPEQFEHSALDVRSDIYSLGETLWFALTGKPPFDGHTLSEIHRAQKSNALPIEQLKAAHAPSRLRSLLGSMLAFEPASRPGTHELATRLQRCSPNARGVQRTRLALAASLITLAAAAGWIVWKSEFIRHPATNGLAVLPFENLSPDPDNAYFAEGIQEEILTRLASIADLRVISRTSTQEYESKPRNLRQIAKQLGVANIVEGSVQKATDQVRVNVQLINAQTDSHLWANTYDRKLTDIFGVESEIAKAIAESLQAKLTGGEQRALAVKPTDNSEAYDAYLRGLAFEARTSTGVEKAIGFFERAVQLDPAFAVAWARLSRANALMYFSDLDSTTARRDASERTLNTAQKLQPNSPETLLAQAYYQYWVLRDYELGKATFGRVRELLPSSSDVPGALALIARRQGHWDKSVAYWEQTLALDPRNTEWLFNSADTYAMLRQFPAALKTYDRLLDIVPNDPDTVAAEAKIYQAEGNLEQAGKLLAGVNAQTPSVSAFLTKINQLFLERHFDEAIRLIHSRRTETRDLSDFERLFDQFSLVLSQQYAGDLVGARGTAQQMLGPLETLCQKDPDNTNFAQVLSVIYAVLGQKDAAIKEAERAITLLPSGKDAVDGPTGKENLAFVEVLVGDKNRAIPRLQRLLEIPYDGYLTPALLRLHPQWDPLRSDPRFQKLCEEKQP